jgi:hypothetical protein
MVEVIPDMPPGTLGFRVSGRLTREDYVSVLVPPLRDAIRAGERLRALYAIGPELHMEPAAVWEDLKAEFEMGIKHRDAWARSSPTSTGYGAGSSCSPGWSRVTCACSARASSSRPRPGWRSRQAEPP